MFNQRINEYCEILDLCIEYSNTSKMKYILENMLHNFERIVQSVDTIMFLSVCSCDMINNKYEDYLNNVEEYYHRKNYIKTLLDDKDYCNIVVELKKLNEIIISIIQ